MIDYTRAECGKFVMHILHSATEKEVLSGFEMVLSHPEFEQHKSVFHLHTNHSILWTPLQMKRFVAKVGEFMPKQMNVIARTPASLEAATLAKGMAKDFGYRLKVCKNLSEMCEGG